jgi:hypothetical protein
MPLSINTAPGGAQIPIAIGDAITGLTAGSILFGGAAGILAQDNSNLFFDNTNDRLGLGINASLLARLHVKGSGATSATSSILFTNSNNRKIFEVIDNTSVKMCHDPSGGGGITVIDGQIELTQYGTINGGAAGLQINSADTSTAIQLFRNVFIVGNGSYQVANDPSAVLQIAGNNKGLMLPKLTTTQKNAVAVTAASSGCIIYDTTLNKICVYSGSAWQTVTSV